MDLQHKATLALFDDCKMFELLGSTFTAALEKISSVFKKKKKKVPEFLQKTRIVNKQHSAHHSGSAFH